MFGEDSLIQVMVSWIIPFISGVFGIIDYIIKHANDFRSKRRLCFFVHELHLVGFSDKEKHYQLNGRLVSKDEVKIESMEFELSSAFHYWEGNSKYYHCTKGNKDKSDVGLSLEYKKTNSPKDTLIVENQNLITDRDYSYELEGTYVVTNGDVNNNEKEDKVGTNGDVDNNEKEDKYIIKKDDITDLKVKVKSQGKEIVLTPIKCPNIRRSWLIIYIIISMLVIFIGVLTTSILIDNWKSVFMRDDWGLIVLFSIYGILLVLITLYFFVANIKCVSQLLVFIRMKKFGVPRKKKIVSDTLLVPKTWEFMAGTEKVDNIL